MNWNELIWNFTPPIYALKTNFYAPSNFRLAGKRLPPPARKLVIERLPQVPPKPQNIVIERWLPYAQSKRQVIFKKAEISATDHQKDQTRNLIIEWQAPEVIVRKEVKYLGVASADPREYAERYVIRQLA